MDEESIEYEIAVENARALDDMDSLPWHYSLAKTYSALILRETIRKVLAIPKEKIRTSRAAYFNHMMQQYAHKKNHHSGDRSRNKDKRYRAS
jgi:hypothetical protein